MLASILSLALGACSSSTPGDATGEGGALGSGGAQTTGGETSAGGASSVGGTNTAGGTTSAGGAATTGGATISGGAIQPATGGKLSSGGAPGTGGTIAAGGSAGPDAAAGTTAAGGATKSGGNSATGGGTSAGGTTKPATGGQASGGTTATGGRNPALITMVKAMAPGWNLGNSFDGNPNVTSWGNPAPNQTLIKAVQAAGFNSIRIPVTWTSHIGAAPSYTIDSAWMASVVQTAQWAMDAGLYAFVNTHHDADGQWVTFPTDPTTVTAEVTAVWTQIATAFKAFDSKLMLECFNEPHSANGGSSAAADLNLYLEACVNAIRGTGGANATRVIMIQGIGASPSSSGIASVLKISVINDPNLIFSVHTYQPTNFGLGNTAYAWGSASDYTSMASSVTQIQGWLPGWGVVIGEWGSMGVQATANRAAHALAYSQDLTTAGMCPMWWDNGGSGNGSYAIFNRTTGAITQPTIVTGIVTGAQKGLATPNTYATLANP
jgi:endoglucanase